MSDGSLALKYQNERSRITASDLHSDATVIPLHYSIGQARSDTLREPNRDKMANSDDLVDAKLGRVAAETDTKIARLEGKLDLVLSKIDASNSHYSDLRTDIADSRRATIANVWVVFAAVVALLVGLAAAAPVIFDLGTKHRDMIDRTVQESITKAAPKPQQ
jgi:hypothetical protein